MSYTFTEEHREYLLRELNSRCSRRPHYSQRAFARDLQISPSTLSDYLKDKLSLSAVRVQSISEIIGLNQEQCSHWIDLVKYRFSQNTLIKKESLVKIRSRLSTEKNAITIEEFKIISEWHHLAFLELIQMDSVQYSKLKTAAECLGLSIDVLKDSVKIMQKLDLISLNSDGLYSVKESTFIGENVPSEAIRHFHHQVLAKAQTALENQDVTERFNSSTFIALPKNKVATVMSELSTLAVKVLEPYSKNDKKNVNDQLYCFSFQFFNLLSFKEKK